VPTLRYVVADVRSPHWTCEDNDCQCESSRRSAAGVQQSSWTPSRPRWGRRG